MINRLIGLIRDGFLWMLSAEFFSCALVCIVLAVLYPTGLIGAVAFMISALSALPLKKWRGLKEKMHVRSWLCFAVCILTVYMGVWFFPQAYNVVATWQGFASTPPPTKELIKLTLEQRILHGGHPVLRWNMDNIYIRQNPTGNIKSDNLKSTEKIVDVIAYITAFECSIRCGN